MEGLVSDDAPAILPRLERGIVEVFWFTTDLSPGRLTALESLLDAAERGRADRFRFDADRARFVAARGQLRAVLGHYVGVPPELIAFESGPYGKPALARHRGDGRVQFSLSHSHGVGAVAVGLEDELGIDIERVRPFDDALRVAQRLFTPVEQEVLRAQPEGRRLDLFFRYWTGKEAVVKSVGLGLSQPLDGFQLRLDGPDAERVQVVCGGVPVLRWVAAVPPLREGFVAALAVGCGPPEVRCREWREE